jgi:hypothetical protein
MNAGGFRAQEPSMWSAMHDLANRAMKKTRVARRSTKLECR